jgi:DNA-directed RNA polymerase subunit RPC12/RpoP
MKRFNPTQLTTAPKAAPVCVFCKRSGAGVQFLIFNPRFKPFGTACVDCEASLPPGTTLPEPGAPPIIPPPAAAYTPPTPPPEVIARREEFNRVLAEREDKIVAHFGQPGADKIAVPDGMMAVTLGLKYDDSDAMTDYFNRHAPLGPEFVVLLVKKQAQTERLAKRALEHVMSLTPIKEQLTWKWKTEKYSMGHGNYLESSGFELPPDLHGLETAYRGGRVTHAHWEFEFTCASRHTRAMHPHASYGRKAAQPATCNSATCNFTLTATRHTKKDYPIWVVQVSERVPREEFVRLREEAKALGGWYSSYRGHGAIPGFTFKDEASAIKFMGDPQEEQAEAARGDESWQPGHSAPTAVPIPNAENNDVFVCADCGAEFAEADVRDEHYMSPRCVGRVAVPNAFTPPAPDNRFATPPTNIVPVQFKAKRPNPLLNRIRKP